MAKRTRIVCTLGPAVDSESTLRSLMQAGMDVACVDAAMGTREQMLARIERVKRVRQELDNPCAIMLDVRGPEIRCGRLAAGKPVLLRAGDRFSLTEDGTVGDVRHVSQSCEGLSEHVEPGTRILLDGGRIELAVDEVAGTEICCTVQTSGTLGEGSLVNLPGTFVPLPVLTDADRVAIIAGLHEGVDFVTVPFVRTGDDVRRMRMFLDANGGAAVKLVAKVETPYAVEDIDDVADVADAVMLSRGVLGLEMTPYDIPHVQKQVVRVCDERCRPVIIATQMLHSVCANPTPTRAEVADVACAVYDGADALMLDDETAHGLYPVVAVQTMARIAEASERHLSEDGLPAARADAGMLVAPSVVRASVRTAESTGAACIITPTTTGRTARLVSKLRPAVPIFAVAPTPEVVRSMQLFWGVSSALGNVSGNVASIIDEAGRLAVRHGIAAAGDIAVVTGGDRATSPRLDRTYTSDFAARADADPSAFAPTNAMYVVELADSGTDGRNA